MSLQFEKSAEKKDYGRIEDGTYPARIVNIIDMGKQVATDYKTGEPLTWDDGNTKIQPKCFIQFEFPTETIEIDGVEKPRWQGKEYVVSNHDKAAMKAVMKAAGVATVPDLLGKAVLCSIGTTSGGNAKITQVSGVMKGMDVPELVNTPVLFDLDDPDTEVYDSLPSFIKTKIDERVTGSVKREDPPKTEVEYPLDEDIPF